MGVSWHHARAYAAWAGMRLLTEAEWEKAACWAGEQEGKRRYPWGDKWEDRKRCNSKESKLGGTTPVGKYSPQGDSFYGCADMLGNVREWTSSLYKKYPYQANDGREDHLDREGHRVLRGSSFDDNGEFTPAWDRRGCYPYVRYNGQRFAPQGFRVGVSSPSLSYGWRIPPDPETLILQVMMERSQRAAAADQP